MKTFYYCLGATAASALATHGFGGHGHDHGQSSNLTFAGVSFPDTPSVHATYDFITQYLDGPTLGHVLRSATFALMLQSKLEANTTHSHALARADREIVTVAALLHDMSWNVYTAATQQFVSPDRRFEVDGAIVARDFLTNISTPHGTVPGWDARRLQLVWDTIALHTSMSIAQYKEPEVALTQVGIGVDVYGTPDTSAFASVPAGSSYLTKADLDAVYAAIPAPGFTEYVKTIGCGLCIRKPATTWDNIIGSVGVAFVEGYSLAGHQFSDVIIARAEREGIQNFTAKIPPS